MGASDSLEVNIHDILEYPKFPQGAQVIDKKDKISPLSKKHHQVIVRDPE